MNTNKECHKFFHYTWHHLFCYIFTQVHLSSILLSFQTTVNVNLCLLSQQKSMNNRVIMSASPSASSSSCSTYSSDEDMEGTRNEKNQNQNLNRNHSQNHNHNHNHNHNQIVKFEIEAAEVLAALAHSSPVVEIESHAVSEPKAWPKGKSGRKRVYSNSSADDDDDNNNTPKLTVAATATATARSLDLAQGQATPEEPQCDEFCKNLKVKMAKEETSELQTSPMCSKTRGSFFSIKSRQNLTEADQEERRIRRILANRESARQTIRRRQAICDELTRKAADLSLENASLKKEKELVEEEYASLKNMNSYLKEQMAMPLKLEQAANSIEQASPHANTAATPSTNSSLLLCNPSQYSPFVWPLIMQSASSLQLQEDHKLLSFSQPPDPEQLQHNPQNTIIFSPRVVNVSGNGDSSHEQASPSNFNSSKTPICLLPCQWVFPLADPGIGHELYHHPSLVKCNQDETPTNTTINGCSSSHALSHTTQFDKKSRPAYNLNETPCDGGVQEGAHSNGIVFKPAAIPSPVTPTVCTTQENGISRDFLFNGDTPSRSCQSRSLLPIKNSAPHVYSNKTPVEVIAAAEARKRRKEVTRLKNLRPFRINC